MQLFLSHASESKPIVQGLAEGLPEHVRWWLDKHEMAAGDRFSSRIEDAIVEHCDYMVVFLDAPALAREWVPREVAWGIERELSLDRPFVIPVLLEDVRARLGEIPQLDGRLYLMALDHTPTGLAQAATALSAQLFFHASRLVERLRSTARRSLLDAFSRELTAYKQAAFQWRASLGNTLDVLVNDAEAQDHVRESCRLYNAAADPFIEHLGAHRDRLTAAWSRYRGLCDDVRTLAAQIERVYRHDLYALNGIHEMAHVLMLDACPRPATDEEEARRSAVLARAGAALDELTRSSTDVIAALEREIT